MKFSIGLGRITETATNKNDFFFVYHITKNLALHSKFFGSSIKNLRKWQEHFTGVLNCITSDKVSPLADSMTSQVAIYGYRLLFQTEIPSNMVKPLTVSPRNCPLEPAQFLKSRYFQLNENLVMLRYFPMSGRRRLL